MRNEKIKVYIYTRVSTAMQIDGYSLEAQRTRMKAFAEFSDYEIVGEYEDAGKSGKSIEGRNAFNRMMEDIKTGKDDVSFVLVFKLSRFGRNAADVLSTLQTMQDFGVNLICVEDGIDSSKDAGKLMISVLSAVAEIERENIRVQTMEGRIQKARDGRWNGGFPPYGYRLVNGMLEIDEEEAPAIRIIYEKWNSTEMGATGLAKYLETHGVHKRPRHNGKNPLFDTGLLRNILRNPVYCGKIAYGRRTREKVKGTKNEYKQVHVDDFILEDGQHEAIIDEELWQKAHTKRTATGIKPPSKTGKDRVHLLTGILRCPKCGGAMYANKHAWTTKDGTYKEVFYYVCGRKRTQNGHFCDYQACLRKTDIEPLVIEAVKLLVVDKSFAEEIRRRIGTQIDTSKLDQEIANYEAKMKEVDLNKHRLEKEIDNLPLDARYRDRKLRDMTMRLDSLYDTIAELEECIKDANLRREAVEIQAITLDNIYKIMINFNRFYDILNDEEKKNLISYLIKEVQIFPDWESSMRLKSIEFNFPIYCDGNEVRRLLWECGDTVECVALIIRNK